MGQTDRGKCEEMNEDVDQESNTAASEGETGREAHKFRFRRHSRSNLINVGYKRIEPQESGLQLLWNTSIVNKSEA